MTRLQCVRVHHRCQAVDRIFIVGIGHVVDWSPTPVALFGSREAVDLGEAVSRCWCPCDGSGSRGMCHLNKLLC
jgi:hypothetical protein